MLFKKTDENNFSDKFEHVYCICRLDNIQLIYFSLFKFDLVFWVDCFGLNTLAVVILWKTV